MLRRVPGGGGLFEPAAKAAARRLPPPPAYNAKPKACRSSAPFKVLNITMHVVEVSDMSRLAVAAAVGRSTGIPARAGGWKTTQLVVLRKQRPEEQPEQAVRLCRLQREDLVVFLCVVAQLGDRGKHGLEPVVHQVVYVHVDAFERRARLGCGLLSLPSETYQPGVELIQVLQRLLCARCKLPHLGRVLLRLEVFAQLGARRTGDIAQVAARTLAACSTTVPTASEPAPVPLSRAVLLELLQAAQRVNTAQGAGEGRAVQIQSFQDGTQRVRHVALEAWNATQHNGERSPIVYVSITVVRVCYVLHANG